MSNFASDARVLSRALLSAWVALDEKLSLPSLVMRQIDEQRQDYSATRSAREYFEAVCYERLLLSGMAWDKSRRQGIAATDRSSYLDWLLAQRFNLHGMDDEPAAIADPAYWRWASLKYANSGSVDRSTWRSYLADARNAAVADCLALQCESEGSSFNPLTSRKIKAVLLDVVAERKLQGDIFVIESAGFGLRFPLALRDYHIDLRIRDVDLLSRRIIPFDFEIASSGFDQNLKLAGDWSVWPGATEYRNVCAVGSTLKGVCTVLVLFVQALVTAVDRTAV